MSAKKLGPGRPTKLTGQCIEDILEGIRMGMSYKRACNCAGISYQTFQNWRGRAESGEREFVSFFDQLQQAENEGLKLNLGRINNAAEKGSWQAAAWIIERRHPREYGKRDLIKVEHPERDDRENEIFECKSAESLELSVLLLKKLMEENGHPLSE